MKGWCKYLKSVASWGKLITHTNTKREKKIKTIKVGRGIRLIIFFQLLLPLV